jgi:hypothetical protein
MLLRSFLNSSKKHLSFTKFPIQFMSTENNNKKSVNATEDNTSSSKNSVDSLTRLVYEGKYWTALRRIRRVSLGSCITGLIVVVS